MIGATIAIPHSIPDIAVDVEYFYSSTLTNTILYGTMHHGVYVMLL
jgi:hypothetical protein